MYTQREVLKMKVRIKFVGGMLEGLCTVVDLPWPQQEIEAAIASKRHVRSCVGTSPYQVMEMVS